MKKISLLKFAIFTGLIVILLVPGVVFAQEATPASPTAGGGLDYKSVIGEMGAWQFWVTLVVTLVCGALGGIVYEMLILQGNIERPHVTIKEEVTETPQYAVAKNLYDLGIWARVIIGALAGIAAFFVIKPASALQLMATTLVAGSAGISIFRSLQDRMLLALSQKETADKQGKLEQQANIVKDALKRVSELKNQASSGVLDVSASGPATTDLEIVEQLLLQAKTLGKS